MRESIILSSHYIITYTSSFQPLNRLAVGCFKGSKDRDITRLELVGSVRLEVEKTDIVTVAKQCSKLQDLECLVRAKAVADQQASLPVCARPSLRIEDTC
jgi:hypothetical protein